MGRRATVADLLRACAVALVCGLTGFGYCAVAPVGAARAAPVAPATEPVPPAPTVQFVDRLGCRVEPGAQPVVAAPCPVLAHPVVGFAATPSGAGTWAAASDGGVFTAGDARFFGSTGAMRLNEPVVGMAATPGGGGYWLVASDGGVFAFGDARFFGSTGAMRLNEPVVGMAATPGGGGYWLVASDGGVFAFGDARFSGSGAGMVRTGVAVNLAPTPGGAGYWLATSAGAVLTFGDARFFGALPSRDGTAAVAGLLPSPSGGGYTLFDYAGGSTSFGDAPTIPAAPARTVPVVGLASGRTAVAGGGAYELLGPAAATGRRPVTKPAGATVALTFDDGPDPTWTPAVLDVLDTYGARATFFAVGSEVRKYPELAREIVRRGHAIANHSWSHARLPLLDDAGIRRELASTNDAIEVATGRRPSCMRPPYGATDARIVAGAQRLALEQILWNGDPEDYTRPGAAVIARRVVAAARAGRILLLHDGGGNRSQTVAALPAVINGIRAKGLGFSMVCG
ncbi:MAG: polysaccharide deacetylase family protein [Acidimicrobiia bacterium]